MVPFLYTPREHHSVTTPEQYRAKHAAFLAKKIAAGQQFTVHEVSTPVAARIEANSWLVDCDCGNGASTHPEWGIACCFGCGAIHTSVVFPDVFTRQAIESLLIARPKPMTRGWGPSETVQDLARENVAHGVPMGDQ